MERFKRFKRFKSIGLILLVFALAFACVFVAQALSNSWNGVAITKFDGVTVSKVENGNVTLGGGVTPIFFDNFNRSDNPCATSWYSGGNWTAATDPAVCRFAISSNAAVFTFVNDGVARWVGKDLGTTYTELWIKYKMTISSITNHGAYSQFTPAGLLDSTQSTHDMMMLNCDSNGTITQVGFQWIDKSASPQWGFGNWSPTNGQTYAIKAHYKANTGTNTDGVLQVWVDGTSIYATTTATFYYNNFEHAVLGAMPYLGFTDNLGNTITYDDFGVYTSDPH